MAVVFSVPRHGDPDDALAGLLREFHDAGHIAVIIPHDAATARTDVVPEYCGKSFSQAGGLKSHMHTVHEGHKDYKCESCGKSFTHQHSLKKHINTVHEGHKDHKCESCGKIFSLADHLKSHICAIHDRH